jgi:putative membrane protein
MNFLAMLNDVQDWQVVGHGTPKFAEAWGPMQWLSLGSTTILGVGLLVLILIAVKRNSRYRAVGVVSEDELESVREEITACEKKTSGEVMVVLLERSDRHPAAHWLAAVCMLFAGSFVLWAWLPWGQPAYLLPLQALLAALGFGLTRTLPHLHHRFISARRAQEMAEEQALQEFHKLELRETKGRTGVLLMVSLLEHRVIVLADEGIYARVGEEKWEEVQQAILKHVRTGHLGQGLLEGVRLAGAVLVEHFPSEDHAEELPNVVIVRQE